MPRVSVEKRDGVAVVWLDQPGEKVNKISIGLIGEFESIMDDLEKDPGVRGVVITSRKEDNFVAGGDLDEFLTLKEPGQAEAFIHRAHALLDRLAASPKPSVAAIRGAAMGGGLEIALACTGRVAAADDRTVMALPEVKLGLLSAGGGTQRLPRLVGLQKALDMLLTGKNVYPSQARRMGLVDYVVSPHALLQTAVSFALDLSSKPKKRKVKLPLWAVPLENTPVGRMIVYRKARDMVRKQTMGNYPAPFKIIDCVEAGLEKGMRAGLDAEAKSFEHLLGTPQSRQLVNLFFGMTALKKNPRERQARKIKKVGILGAGFMGAGIAQVTAEREIDVVMKDVSQEALGLGEKTLWQELGRKVKKRALTPFQRDLVLGRIAGTTTYKGFENADIVIEAVFEDLELKRKILAETEAATGPDCIFASNTSALPISEIAARSKRPEQVLGMHYFSPVPKMPLLEIIVTPKTADGAAATATQLGVIQGKTVIVVKDGPGFYTTRILAPLLHEALLLLEEGGEVRQIDGAMRRFGYPVGPITLLDEVGIDVGAHVARGVIAKLFAGRDVKASGALEKLFEAGYKGRKNRKGFYRYDERPKGFPLPGRKKKEVNEDIYAFFGGPARKTLDVKEIQERLSLLMVNEAALCLEEGIIGGPRDGDVGAVLGLGFPPFLGGPFRYIDSLGPSRILSLMEKLGEKHGARFRPARIIRDHASSGKRFHGDRQ
jgi:3-hydroxyacyl-CoA dehydrogenase/enoyl-CoA hydratase/3-hydroxybutyryl-CoA epimerase